MTNLTLNTEVLAEAKKLGINISKACDAFLESPVRQEKERLWKLENADFIAGYNKTIEDEGLPLDGWRTFKWRDFAFMKILGGIPRPHL